jgi:hypothetical protein
MIDDKDILWIEWLARGERWGSYLRALGGWSFKAPDAPPRGQASDSRRQA